MKSVYESLAGAGAGADVSVVFVTVEGEQEAQSLAEALVRNRLAACVNIIPSVTSVYHWNNSIESDKCNSYLTHAPSSVVPSCE